MPVIVRLSSDGVSLEESFLKHVRPARLGNYMRLLNKFLKITKDSKCYLEY